MIPIVLFTYKRFNRLQDTVQALQNNIGASDSELHIFSDWPENDTYKEKVFRVRKYIRTITGFKEVHIYEANEHKGLADSIIDGVTKVLETHEEVIVLEDDLYTTSNFLVYMNQTLKKYKEATQVFSISGYSLNLNRGENNPNLCYFLNRGWSWGWGTWKDRWERADWDVKDYKVFKTNHVRRRLFARGGSDLNAMLDKQMSGRLDSWAIRWYYTQFINDGLTLYPLGSKVLNRGFDEYATHTKGSNRRYQPYVDNVKDVVFDYPNEVRVDQRFQKRFIIKMGIRARIISKMESILKRFIFFR